MYPFTLLDKSCFNMYIHLKALNCLFDTFNVKKIIQIQGQLYVGLSFFPTLTGIFTRLLFVGDVAMSVARTALVDQFQFARVYISYL